jgi:ribose 5-phosphate isomerase B
MGKKILIAADHAGYEMKAAVEKILKERGYEYEDMGTNSPASTDYADYAHPLAEKISDGEADRGILLCGTGLGMSYAANRHPHVRAAVVWSPEIAALAREHNDANVLAMGARLIGSDMAKACVAAFLDTPFSGGRHQRRVDQLSQELQYSD